MQYEQRQSGLYVPRTPISSADAAREKCAEILKELFGDESERELPEDWKPKNERELEQVRLQIGARAGMALLDDHEILDLFRKHEPYLAFLKVVHHGKVAGVAQALSKKRDGLVSEKVAEYSERLQAEAIVSGGHRRFPRMAEDDRFADNTEMILGAFTFPENDNAVVLPTSTLFSGMVLTEEMLDRVDSQDPFNKKINGFHQALASGIHGGKYEGAVDYVMRLPSEYFRLIMYYGRPRSFEQLMEISNAFKASGHEMFKKGGLTIGPVDSLAQVNPTLLDTLLEKAQVRGSKEFGEFVFDKGRYAYMRIVDPDFNKYVCSGLAYESPQQFSETISLLGSAILGDVHISRDGNSLYHEKGDALRNIGLVAESLKIEEVGDLIQLLKSSDLTNSIRNVKYGNLKILLDLVQPRSARELLDLVDQPKLQENARRTNFAPLIELLEFLQFDQKALRKSAIRILSRGYSSDVEKHCISILKALSEHTSDPNFHTEEKRAFGSLVESILIDADYVGQNLSALRTLCMQKPLSSKEIARLQELRGEVRGFITPVLGKRYIALDQRSDREELLCDYRAKMTEVLGGSAIEGDDPDLVAEVTYLAYRPIGVSIAQITEDLRSGRVQDHTDHLIGKTLRQEGYEFGFQKLERSQTEEFDVGALNAVENRILRKPSKPPQELLRGIFSQKKGFSEYGDMMLATVLRSLDDYRVTSYQEEYKQGKTYSDVFAEERLERLSELLRVIPAEPEFKEAVGTLIAYSPEAFDAARDAVEQDAWMKRKGTASQEVRDAVNALHKIAKRFQGDTDSVRSLMLSSEEEKLLGEIGFSLAEDSPERALENVRATRWKLIFGTDYEESELSERIAAHLQKLASQHYQTIRAEQRKVEAVRSDAVDRGRAYVSKNVASFYAKAGAELCTGLNIGMWDEERHLHLNFEINGQIVGNIMLYFEPEREYLVVRGFNPRNDALLDYDRRSIAQEMVRVVEEIARDNGYSEVFVPPQGGFIALSNREGIAKEVLLIASRNQQEALMRNVNQRVAIRDAAFNVRGPNDKILYGELLLLSSLGSTARSK